MTPKQVVAYYGSPGKAAAALGRTKASVSYWVTHKKIPLPMQHLIQNMTGGKLKVTGT